MSDYKEYSFHSKNSLVTEEFAERIGRQLRGGEIIELIGDIGAGKTTFVRGLVKAVDSVDMVSSPTFAIYNVYRGRLAVYHYDLYRLRDDELIRNEFTERLDDLQAVLVLEWAQELQDVLPVNRLKIEFEASGDTDRVLKLALPDTYNYMELV